MSKVWRGLFYGIAIEITAVAVIWAAIRATGTPWVWPFLAVVGVPLLAFTTPGKPKRRRYR